MIITKNKLPCGYTAIPLVINGAAPDKTVADIAARTFALLEQDSADDKLSWNYTQAGLKLKDMAIYTVLWDYKQDQPVLVTGAQHTSDNTCRLFSRYYLFKNYRTGIDNRRYDKVDDFQVDMWHWEILKNQYSFFYWSREKGPNFFKRIKMLRPDVFSRWQVWPDNIELLWKNNWQGIFYTSTKDPQTMIDELTFNK